MADFSAVTCHSQSSTSWGSKQAGCLGSKRSNAKGLGRQFVYWTLAVVLALGSLCASAETATYQFDIPEQTADRSLTLLAQQAKVPLLFSFDEVRDVTTNAVVGEYTLEAALTQLLAGTDLEGEVNSHGVLTVARRPEEALVEGELRMPGENENMPTVKRRGLASVLLAMFSVGAGAQEVADADEKESVLEEIVVTGTNIRGVNNPTSPLLQFDREDIDLAGVGTVQDFVRTIPQNFNSTTPVSFNSDNPFDGAVNQSAGTVIDLRGLGSGATLTLLNGRRLAFSGSSSVFDVSSIPLSVVDRIDVLTDGASAIYGSDAIAGVVNLVTRRDFAGLETRARYGTVTAGNMDETELGTTGGMRWGSGGGFITLQYTDIEPLFAADRDYADLSTAFAGGTLIPKQEAFNAFASFDHDFTNRLAVIADLMYTDRDVEFVENDFLAGRTGVINSETAFFTTRLDYRLTERITASVFVDYGKEETESRDSDDSFLDTFVNDNELLVVEGQLSGAIADLPGGSVAASLGGLYREEEFRRPDSATFGSGVKRDVAAIYGEVLIPLIGEGQSVPYAQELTFSAAGRYEDYSDFGDTFNPKLGLFWRISEDIALRGSYSESFRAPSLTNTAGRQQFAFLAFPDPEFDPSQQDPRAPDGSTFFLISAGGGNPNLTPEEATSWTGGVEFTPRALTGLRMNSGFFDVSYTNRIDSLPGLIPLTVADFFSLVDRNPDPGRLDEIFDLIASGDEGAVRYVNASSLESPGPDDVQAIVNAGTQNLSSFSVRGLDLALGYDFQIEKNAFNTAINASYILDYKIQISDTAQPFDAVNQVYRPADMNLRGSFSWSRGGVTLFAAVNYVDSYIDNQVGNNNVQIDDWATVDLTFAYDSESRYGASQTGDIRFSLSVQNLFDEAPPFVATTDGLNFDTANANPLGRFASFQITKTW